MIRITAGKLKNKKLEVPEVSRPLTDRIRISVFDLIRDFIPEASVLDLYAGSGVTGLEAMSRGASSCTFVDNNFEVIQIIKQNIQICNLSDDQFRTEYVTASSFLKSIEMKEKFDIIFLDPPFDSIPKLNLNNVATRLDKEGIVVARLPNNFTIERVEDIENKYLEEVYKKSYGKSEMVFYKHKV